MKTVGLFLASILCICGCKDIKQDLDSLFNEKKSSSIIVLVDFSTSIPQNTIDWYNQVIKDDILMSLQVNDKLVILPVDKAAQTSGVEIAAISLDQLKFTSMQDPPNQKHELIKRRINKFLHTFSIEFTNRFYKIKEQRSKYANETDIFGALKQAIKYFKLETKNSIIILSDMKQETEEFSIVTYLNNKQGAATVLKKTNPVDLTLANIFILTGEQPNTGIKDLNWLKEFWKGYIENNHGKLVIYESGGVSLLKDNL